MPCMLLYSIRRKFTTYYILEALGMRKNTLIVDFVLFWQLSIQHSVIDPNL